MSRIVVTDLVKDFKQGGAPAVDRISLVAEEGSLLALLGPSGCGKSTTLRMIAGLEEVTSGRIEIGGRDVTRMPPAQRQIAMVFQSYAIFPHLSVAENIVFGLRVRRVDAAHRARKLQEAAELLGLSALLDRKPAQLSGGQRQRVALGRAIVAEARVCLMDEPLSNLDAQLRHQMRVEIRALQKRLGMTMVYVTHDQTEAMTMADRIVLMRAGHIEQQGTPSELYQSPASAFVAGFLGSPPANVVPLAALDARAAGDPRSLSIRPERMRVVGRDEPAGHPDASVMRLPAVIESIEYLGAESLLACRAGSALLTVRVPGVPPEGVGASVALTWDATEQRFYDTAQGHWLEGATPPGFLSRPINDSQPEIQR